MKNCCDEDNYTSMRRYQRYYTEQISESKDKVSDVDGNNVKTVKHEVQKLSNHSYSSKLKVQQSADKNSLFEFFLAQAKERDAKARLEKLALSKFGKRRSRSSSLNRSQGNMFAEHGSVLSKSNDLTRSNSINISRSIITSGLRRSRSSIDIKEIISKAEIRDQQARSEQARLEGMTPVQRKDGTNTKSSRPASKSMKEFKPDSNMLTKHSESNNSLSGLPDQSEGDNKKSSTSKSTNSSRRKFSSFLNNSRVARSAGMYYIVRCFPDDNRHESYRSSLYRTHSARSSSWNGSEIRYLEHSPLNTNPEMEDACRQNEGLHIQDENNNNSADYPNVSEASSSTKNTESLQRHQSTYQASLNTNPSTHNTTTTNNQDDDDSPLDVKSCDEASPKHSNKSNYDYLPLPPPDLFQNEDEELERIGLQNQLDIAEPSSNKYKDNDRMRWQKEQKIKKEKAEARAKLEAKRREERQRQREQREEERKIKEAETRNKQKRKYEKKTTQIEREDQETKWSDNYNDLIREEEEQRLKLEELRKMRKEEEKQLEELLAKRKAEENKQRRNIFHKRKKKNITEQIEKKACKKNHENFCTEEKINHSFKNHNRDPSRMTFKDRQRLFQGGANTPVAKIKSRKLLEIEESLRNEL